MQTEKLSFLVLAALLHDIGKILERGEIFADARKDPVYLESCPQDKGYPTHLHAAHTRAFCDWLEKQFDCLREYREKSWKDWCSAHHKNDETGFESSVIRISDRLSSSEREEGNYYKREIHRKTLLEPVVERVFLAANKDMLATRYRYPLVRLTSERDHFFAVKGSDLGLDEMASAEGEIRDLDTWTHLIAAEPLIKEYREVGEAFMNEIRSLADKRPDMAISHLVATMTTLLEKYTANVPSATNVRHPDISLFDHLFTTAAIAQALYCFHVEQKKPKYGLESKDEPKWLLVCGDFSGIQKFIYNLTNKGAAKGLRGRSFYVQYFCKICSEFILRQLGLTRSALLYNSGGKFYLLLPANLQPELFRIRTKVNAWLMEQFSSDVFFGIGVANVTAAMFEQGAMDTAWKTVAENLEQDRLIKFKEFLSPAFFDPDTNFDPTKSCPVCGSRRIGENEERCATCTNLESLGSSLRETGAILTIWDDDQGLERIEGLLNLNRKRSFSFSAFGVHCLLVPGNKAEQLTLVKGVSGECVFLNEQGDLPFSELPLPNCAISSMYLGKWEAGRQINTDGSPWDFDDYARNSRGISRLGILRMDVDNLGMVFIRGLNFPTRETIHVDGNKKEGWGDILKDGAGNVQRKPMASISRIVTLSRQLNQFFSGYIPRLLTREEFNKCQIIYAGGDDLFVIGSWDQLPGLAKTVREEFKSFCCHNPDWSISGGITLHRGKYPLYKGAQLAGESEKKAKDLRKNRGIALRDMEKDGFCFLGVPIVWEDMEMAEYFKTMIEDEIEKNRGLLSFLSRMTARNNTLADMISRERGMHRALAWKEIEYGSWRWRTAYQLRRRYSDEKKRKVWADALFASKHDGKEATLPVYSWLELPLRWTDYLHREKGGK